MDAEPSWIRLFPLDFRGLERARRFKKYETIELDVVKSRDDPRPESYAPVLESIEVGDELDTDGKTWRRRLAYLEPVEGESMCALQDSNKTLGMFRPEEIRDLTVTLAEPGFEAKQQAIIDQASLFGDRTGDSGRPRLEPLPVKAKFDYRCADVRCRGHRQSFIDWELGALFRNLRDREGYDEVSCLNAVKDRFLGLCGPRYETRFIAGSMLRYPKSFLILGLATPERGAQPELPFS